jgi:RNA polymerase sigma factor (sigma-70 family)
VRGPEAERRRQLEALFEAHGSDVVSYCGWRAGSTADAQDAASEVFLIAWRRLDDIPDGEAARVWLYATARRVLANQRRSRRRRAALRERLTRDAALLQHEPAPADRDDAVVHEALGRLSRRDREVLLLAEWEGLSPAQIAQVLGCLVVTARSRLHRARRRFRDVFEELTTAVPASGRGAREPASVSRYSVQPLP